MFVKVLRVVVAVVCVGGIAGMIVSTIATDNNNGVVITFGILTALAVVVLMAVTAALKHSAPAPAPVVDEDLAEQLEARVQSLVDAGADEQALRSLVRDAVRLGRGVHA